MLLKSNLKDQKCIFLKKKKQETINNKKTIMVFKVKFDFYVMLESLISKIKCTWKLWEQSRCYSRWACMNHHNPPTTITYDSMKHINKTRWWFVLKRVRQEISWIRTWLPFHFNCLKFLLSRCHASNITGQENAS